MFTAAAHPTWRSEFAATLRLAVPLALAGLLQMATHAIDVVFVARLGTQELAAASLSFALYGTVAWSLTGLTGSAAALIAAELGRRRHAVREVRRSLRMALWLAVACAVVGMVICSAGESLMRATGQDDHIAERSGDFLAILLWSVPGMIGANVLRSFVSALGRPIFATAITGVGVVVNALGNYIFVFGHFGAPALGLEGSAVSSVITSLIIFSAYVAAIEHNRILRRYRIWGRWWRPEWERLGDLLRIGTPVAVTIIAEAGFFSGAAFLMGRIGPAELAGHTLALNIASLAFQVPFAIGQAATIRVGYHFGGRNVAAIRLAGWAAIALGTGFMTTTAAAMLFAPNLLLSAYVDVSAHSNAALVAFAVRYMMVAAAFQLFDGVQSVAMGALRGLQDTRVPMAFAIFGYWVPGLACCLWLGFWTPLAGTGIWIGLAVGLVVVAALMLWRWSQRERLGAGAGLTPFAKGRIDLPADRCQGRKKSLQTPLDGPLPGHHMRAAGTLHVRVPTQLNTQLLEEVIIMAFRPLHDRVLVRRLEAEEKTAGGIIIPDSAKEKPSEGEIVATGSGARSDDGKITPMDVKAGDRVLFGKWSGTEVKIDGEDLLIMKESDIMGVIA